MDILALKFKVIFVLVQLNLIIKQLLLRGHIRLFSPTMIQNILEVRQLKTSNCAEVHAAVVVHVKYDTCSFAHPAPVALRRWLSQYQSLLQSLSQLCG